VRSLVRDSIRGSLPGADALVPNSVLRVLSDIQGAVCHLTLQFLDWLALQLIPDTAETIWLDRHGDIWLTNADGSTGRKMATLAEGSIAFTGVISGLPIPKGTQLLGPDSIAYETTEDAITSASDAVPVEVPARALDPGAAGNLAEGTGVSLQGELSGVSPIATIVEMDGGVDTESDDQLRMRVLQRIRQPPMGGATHDYVRWALAVPGVTRAWVAPVEMGIGTVTVRVLFDDLRADDDGWPQAGDLAAATAYIDTMRPVAVKDFWVLAPIKQFIDAKIGKLSPDTAEVRAQIEASLRSMLFAKAAPGQTIYAAWKAAAIMDCPNVSSFDLLDWKDDVMASAGNMAVLGDIVYG
jgi:uncharacterized phage protein gp47/JayE